ncbi:hypothetical protein VF13_38755, partial [Nostoc linckia z16]
IKVALNFINSNIKVALNFINSNYLTEILNFGKSFQHANVFGSTAQLKRFFMWVIYIILTFEVNL